MADNSVGASETNFVKLVTVRANEGCHIDDNHCVPSPRDPNLGVCNPGHRPYCVGGLYNADYPYRNIYVTQNPTIFYSTLSWDTGVLGVFRQGLDCDGDIRVFTTNRELAPTDYAWSRAVQVECNEFVTSAYDDIGSPSGFLPTLVLALLDANPSN